MTTTALLTAWCFMPDNAQHTLQAGDLKVERVSGDQTTLTNTATNAAMTVKDADFQAAASGWPSLKKVEGNQQPSPATPPRAR